MSVLGNFFFHLLHIHMGDGPTTFSTKLHKTHDFSTTTI